MSRTVSRKKPSKRRNPVAYTFATNRPRGQVIPSARVYKRKVKHAKQLQQDD